jgi:hypothetical protein
VLNWEECESKKVWPILMHCFITWLNLPEDMKGLSWYIWSPGRSSNSRPSDYEVEVVTSILKYSV